MKILIVSLVVISVLAAGARTASAQHENHHQAEPSPSVPAVTEADRQAAFPDVEGHAVHDRAVHYFVLLDQLEWQSVRGGTGFYGNGKGWAGRDRDRIWFRAEGDGDDGRVDSAAVQLLYGRHFSRWWDAVAGVRQDFRPGPSRTWAAIGIQGIAPYWFEVALTGYVGTGGHTFVRGEVEYELLLTNRLILQPLVEVEVFGKSDRERGIGAGLSTTEAGVRVRYEIRREFAPYVGVVWHNTYGGTARFARAADRETADARLVTGVRFWF